MLDPLDFSGRVILITGAASGIGAACAKWLADRGAAGLVLVDLDEDRLQALELACPARCFAGDVADERLWDRISRKSPRFDHAVLNAGIADSAPIAEIDFAAWRKLMAVNLDGIMLSLRCAMRTMLPAGRGSVVLTASVGGVKPEPGTAAYGASKAAVIHLAKVAAKEGAPRGVRVNVIAPGGVDTPLWDKMPMFNDLVTEHGSHEAAIAALGKLATPLGRYATAAEIAGQVGFLLSDMAATVTGAVLVSDGGYSL